MDFLRSLFLAGVYGFPGSVTDDGGVECYAQMSDTYRVSVAAGSLAVHSLLYRCFSRPFAEKRLGSLQPGTFEPSKVERAFGLLVLFTWMLQVAYKALTHRLINMFNPCHVITLMEAYLLLSPWSKRTEQVFLCFLSWHFGSYRAT